MTRSDPDNTHTADIISIAARLEQAARDRDYDAVHDLNIALRQQATTLANGHLAEAVNGQAAGALWRALEAVHKASSTVDTRRADLVRRRGQAKLLHFHYGQAGKS
ncbi:hypothetical protein ACVDG3_14975 [Meridianimarinicoccus sp. RP-17]|uniref:hypothetical protein n=1 Tax=Meridianimarinicoccus zhengii TaxID=2056810 RepID=UPI000DACE21F|nr:hypothetical protein [Phycocomes zhengii]